jgi:hypothetical protein
MFRHTRQETLEPSTAERRKREREREKERERNERSDWSTFLKQLEEGFDDVQVEGSAPWTSYEFPRPPTQNSRVDPRSRQMIVIFGLLFSDW